MQAEEQFQPQEDPRWALYTKITDLSSSKFDFKAKAKQLEEGVLELSLECEKRTAECQAAIDGLRSAYSEIITEAFTEAAKIHQAAVDEASVIHAEVAAEKAAWEVEKARLAHIHTFKPKIKLDVGGKTFATSLATLRRFPDTMIGAMFSGRHQLETDEDGCIFIDQDGTHFGEILNFLRKPEGFVVDLPPNELRKLKVAADYYGLLHHMFPFVPAEPMNVLNTQNQHCSVTQDKDGLWYGNSVLMKVCRKCCAADYSAHSSSNSAVGGFAIGSPAGGLTASSSPFRAPGSTRLPVSLVIQKFTNGMTARELADGQPEPDCCSCCGAQKTK